MRPPPARPANSAIRWAGSLLFDRSRRFAPLGYDHMTPEDEKEMRGLQGEIMERAGLAVKGE